MKKYLALFITVVLLALGAVVFGIATKSQVFSEAGAESSDGAQTQGPRGPSIASGFVARGLVERPIALAEDVGGRLHQPVSTDDLEAHAYYDQGITYLVSYAWVDAARSFHAALRRDPGLAMAHLGLAKAYTGLEALDMAAAHIQQAQALARDDEATPKERKWIELGRQQFDALSTSTADPARAHQAYRQALEALIALDTDDPHAWVLRGNAEEAYIGGRGQGGLDASLPYYEAALRRDSTHLAAHHYLTHAYENTAQYDKAAEHAGAYAAAAPSAPHAQHMYGHVLPRLGRWQEALDQLTKADRLHRARFEAEGMAPEDDWHFGHNLRLLGAVHFRLGREPDAARCFEEAYGLTSRRFLGVYDGLAWVEYLLLRERFDEALAAAETLEQRSAWPDQIVGAALGGEALIGLGRMDEATRALSRAEQALTVLQVVAADSPEYARRAPARMQHFVQFLETVLALTRLEGPAGEEQALSLADRIAAASGMDGWALGLVRLERLAAVADRAGRSETARAVQERLTDDSLNPKPSRKAPATRP